MYSTNEDIRDGFLRPHAKDYDHALARDFIDRNISKDLRDRIKDLPIVKELSVAYASYKIARRKRKRLGDIFSQKIDFYEDKYLEKLTSVFVLTVKYDEINKLEAS